MKKEASLNEKVGILGGGQLGRMMIQAALEYKLHLSILDPSNTAPASTYAHRFVQGSLTDAATVIEFGKDCDIISIEIENVSTEGLAALEAEGKMVRPSASLISLVQDKSRQKQFYAAHGYPTADFLLVSGRDAIRSAAWDYPFVNKLATAGYDGRGVQVINNKSDLEKAFDTAGIIERFVPFEKEIAVIVARNPSGQVKCFPAVEMVFHPVHNLVEYLISPADIHPDIAKEAASLATRLATELQLEGLLAVEMFVTKESKVLINEIAPRPHNSGHHTIRACGTSQFEQHLRAILDLPLGDTSLLCPAAMVNLLGEAGYQGDAVYQGITSLLEIEGAYPHLYGKKETRPFRKMGHVTIIDKDRQQLIEKVEKVRKAMKIISH